jgi:transcription antitermination factor NusG
MRKSGSGQSQGKWCILRTSAARTLNVVKSLNGAGIGAWSPRRTIERRRGVSRARYEVEVPILPTFIFVPADFTDDVRRIVALPNSPHPAFSLFIYRDAIPLILDNELYRIREEEERFRVRVQKTKRFDFSQGDGVRVDDAESAFLGMSGVVESCDGKRAWVKFAGNFRVNIGAWKLLTDQVQAA